MPHALPADSVTDSASMSAQPLIFSNPPPTMPVNQVQKNRRKRTTPVIRRDQGHVLHQTLDTLGLASLNYTSPPSTKMADDAVGMAAPDKAVARGEKKISIPDLPLEVQRAIFKHVGFIPFNLLRPLRVGLSMLTFYPLPGGLHRTHSPLPRFQALPRSGSRSSISKLPHCLP